MADYRKILGLLLEGRSYREVVEIAGCSHRDVARVRQEVQERGLTSMVAITDAELAKWFPDGRRKVSEEYVQPDLARVVASMKQNRHFTLLLAWRRYVDTKDAGKKYGYSQFCALFTDYLRTHDLVAVLRHEPGRAMLVDWAGDTIDLADAVTGEITRAVLFVAVLPFSGMMFCRAYADMKSPAWLDAHVQSFAFFGGVPQIVVPDNPTTSTHQTHKGDAERVVNARYQQFVDRARSFGPATVTVIEQILGRQAIEAQGYLDCQNILEQLGKRNRGRLEATCQELVNQRGHATYSTLKRTMAAIDSDNKRSGPLIPAASTRKPASTVVFRDTYPDVYVRNASHYARDEQGI